MSTNPVLQEDLELDRLRAHEQLLMQLEKEAAELPKRLLREQRERECTMPPLPEIEERRRLRDHEQTVTRGQVTNILRNQTRSLLLLILLLTATASLIWWGVKLMNG